MMTARSIVGHTVLAVLLQSFAVARGISQTEGSAVGSPIAGVVSSQADALATSPSPEPGQSVPANSTPSPTGVPVTIQLNDAITRALANQPVFAAAAAQAKIAKLDRSIARAALLPSAVYNNQFLYTQGGAGLAVNPIRATDPNLPSNSAPRFIANNAVHEYISQGSVTETIGLQQFNTVSKTSAGLAIANAELEIARRGLVATVVGLYYNSLATDRKVKVAQGAAAETANFTKQTQQREVAREVAHADVVKAQLLQQQRDRDLADAKLNADKAAPRSSCPPLPRPPRVVHPRNHRYPAGTAQPHRRRSGDGEAQPRTSGRPRKLPSGQSQRHRSPARVSTGSFPELHLRT